MVCVEHHEVSCRLHGGQSLGSSCDQRPGWLPGHVNPWTGFDVQEAAAVPLLSSAASEAGAKGSSDSTESNLFFLGQQH